LGDFLYKLLLNKYTIAIAVTLAATGFFAFQNHQIKLREQRLTELSAEVHKLSIEKDAARAQVKELTKIVESNTILLKAIKDSQQATLDNIKQEIKIVNDRRLNDLANKKPGLIEIRANKATERVFQHIEDETKKFHDEQSQ
jgi:hypothetical protein